MHEDWKLTAFVKDRLEEDVSDTPPHLQDIERAAVSASFALAAASRSRRRTWGIPLVAASLAVVFGSFVALNTGRSPEPEQTVACVIDLLCASDGNAGGIEADSVAEKLLAWQDAPYEHAIAGLVANKVN